MSNIKYLDQLSEFHLRDITRIKPGAKVLFGHVPTLGDPSYSDSKESARGELAEVTRVDSVSFSELYAFSNTPEWAGSAKKNPVIFYNSGNYEGQHRYATDSGVLPYNEGTDYYNSTNFTVLLEDLEAAGVELVLEASAEYQSRLEEFNSQVYEYSMDYDLED